jgi:hypothetical protein
VKTVCSNPNGVRATNFTTPKDVTFHSKNYRIDFDIKTPGRRLAKAEVLI